MKVTARCKRANMVRKLGSGERNKYWNHFIKSFRRSRGALDMVKKIGSRGSVLTTQTPRRGKLNRQGRRDWAPFFLQPVNQCERARNGVAGVDRRALRDELLLALFQRWTRWILNSLRSSMPGNYAQQRYLHALEDAIINAEFSAHLAALSTKSTMSEVDDSRSQDQLWEDLRGTSTASPPSPAQRKQQRRAHARFVEKAKQRAEAASARAGASRHEHGRDADITPAN